MKKILLILILISFSFSFSLFASDKKYSTLEGKELLYDELTASPKTILFLWATWCPYCQREIDKLIEKRKFYKSIGVKIFYINVGEDKNLVENFARSKKFTSTTREKMILDPSMSIAKRFSVSALPTFIFLKDGKIAQRSYTLNDAVLNRIFGDQ